MKKYKYFLILICAFYLGLIDAYAATSSITAPKQVESGKSVTATIKVNAAAWNINVNGTGNTNGCSKLFADDSGTGNNVNKSFTVTCTANSTGMIKINYSGDISDANGTTKDVSGSVMVTVIAPVPKSTNNYLNSLGVEGGILSPDFNKDTLDYTVTLEAGTEKVIINAEKADGKASVSGTGEQAVQEGDNKFEIIVTAENGSQRTYNLNVVVKEFAPIEVKINGKTYTVVRKEQDLSKPETFEESTVTIGEETVPAFYNEKLGKTLVGLKDEEGNISLFVYKDGKYERYYEFSFKGLTINIEKMKVSLLPKEYKIYSETINGEKIAVYKYSKNSIFALVYGVDVTTGKKDLYQIDLKNNTIQLFNKESFDMVKENNKTSLMIFAICGGVMLLEFLIILLSRRKSKKILNRIKEDKIEKVKKIAIEEAKDESIDRKDIKTEEINLENTDIIDEPKKKNSKKKSE